MIAVIDYGVGNLFSLVSSLKAVGAEAKVASDPAEIRSADRLILPGVGAFGDASRLLRESGMAELVTEQAAEGKYILGICLGMQLLFDVSYEYGEYAGLGLIPGRIVPLRSLAGDSLKIPHMGWNALKLLDPACPVLKNTREGDFVYFVHSYCADGCLPNTAAVAEYGADVTAVVAKDSVFGCQFHPEKSGSAGLGILKAFCEMRY